MYRTEESLFTWFFYLAFTCIGLCRLPFIISTTTTINPGNIYIVNNDSDGAKYNDAILHGLDTRNGVGQALRLCPSACNCDKYQTLKQLFKTTPGNKSSRILITGGAGFIGSHLVDRLMHNGDQVVVLDDLSNGNFDNILLWAKNPNFKFFHSNVVRLDIFGHDISTGKSTDECFDKCLLQVLRNQAFNYIYHLASPATPTRFMKIPLQTLHTNILGSINIFELAKHSSATILVASSSEIYGDPLVHPQNEQYYGNVNSFGPRSCYDEGKRMLESLAYAYKSEHHVPVRIARIFNTYGPRLSMKDGRVISNFLNQALNNKSMTVRGDGKQTRSFMYITDLIDGLVKLMYSDVDVPVNLGNPSEMTIIELAKLIQDMIPTSTSEISFIEPLIDDPRQRKPDINRANTLLNWTPHFELKQGLKETVDFYIKTNDIL